MQEDVNNGVTAKVTGVDIYACMVGRYGLVPRGFCERN